MASATIVSVQTQQSPSGDHTLSQYALDDAGQPRTLTAETHASTAAVVLNIREGQGDPVGVVPWILTIEPGSSGPSASLQVGAYVLQIPSGCLDDTCVTATASGMPGKDYGAFRPVLDAELPTQAAVVSSFLQSTMPWGAWLQIIDGEAP